MGGGNKGRGEQGEEGTRGGGNIGREHRGGGNIGEEGTRGGGNIEEEEHRGGGNKGRREQGEEGTRGGGKIGEEGTRGGGNKGRRKELEVTMIMYICDRKCQHTSQNMTVPSSEVIHNLLLHTPPTYPCRKEDGVMCGQGEVAVLVCLVDVLLSLQVHCLQLLEHLLVYPAETSVLNREKVRWSVLSKGWGMVCKCVCGWVWSVCPHR